MVPSSPRWSFACKDLAWEYPGVQVQGIRLFLIVSYCIPYVLHTIIIIIITTTYNTIRYGNNTNISRGFSMQKDTLKLKFM